MTALSASDDVTAATVQDHYQHHLLHATAARRRGRSDHEAVRHAQCALALSAAIVADLESERHVIVGYLHDLGVDPDLAHERSSS